MARQLPESALTPVKWRKLVVANTGLGERRVKMVMNAMIEIAIDHLERGEIVYWPGLFSAETWITEARSRNLPVMKTGHHVGEPIEERKIYHFPPRRAVIIFPGKSLKKKIANSTPPGSEATRRPVSNWKRRQDLDAQKKGEQA